MKSMERKLFQAITTQFSNHLLENSIFSHFSLFVPAYGQPLDPISAFIDKNVITGCCCNDICKEKATPNSTPFSQHLPENWIFSHFSPFVPTHVRPLDPASPFIDKNVFTGCCCKDKYGERATAVYYAPFSSHFPENWVFGNFSAIFYYLCLLMGNPLTPSPLLLPVC